jgi:hypothetical protein
MKKIASIFAFAASIFALALPSSAQVIPIIGGSITINGVRNGNGGIDITIPSSNLLTPAGTVSLTTIANYTYIGNNGGNNFSLTSTSFNTSVNPFLFPITSSTLTGDANGDLAGTPFTTKPIVITTAGIGGGAYSSSLGILNNFSFDFTNRVTGGSLTLSVPAPVIPAPVIPAPVIPAPVTCDGCLIVRPEDLLIANSTFLSPDLQKPEYRQEYRNDFSASSFRGGRILALEDN